VDVDSRTYRNGSAWTPWTRSRSQHHWRASFSTGQSVAKSRSKRKNPSSLRSNKQTWIKRLCVSMPIPYSAISCWGSTTSARDAVNKSSIRAFGAMSLSSSLIVATFRTDVAHQRSKTRSLGKYASMYIHGSLPYSLHGMQRMRVNTGGFNEDVM